MKLSAGIERLTKQFGSLPYCRYGMTVAQCLTNSCSRNMNKSSPPLSINSVIGGITWPAVPAVNAAALLSILFQLEQTQWWTPEQILVRQRDQLQALLEHARANVPFYRERLRNFPELPDKN